MSWGWPSAYSALSDAEKASAFDAIIARWREPGLTRIRPAAVIPDATVRHGTGLSPKHVHWLAAAMQQQGFDTQHEVPVAIRETVDSAGESLAKWRRAQAEHACLPQGEPSSDGAGSFFATLGSSHLLQALNLFGSAARAGFSEAPSGTGSRFEPGSDAALRAAVEDGVECLVLAAGIPAVERRFVGMMLNTAREGQGAGCSSLDAMCGAADAWELEELVERRAERRGLRWALEEGERAGGAAPISCASHPLPPDAKPKLYPGPVRARAGAVLWRVLGAPLELRHHRLSEDHTWSTLLVRYSVSTNCNGISGKSSRGAAGPLVS